METNAFGTNLGEAFGTLAWLWIFYRFSQDGKVLLGYEHPWDHGHADHGDDVCMVPNYESKVICINLV